jgi:hypothetical protein
VSDDRHFLGATRRRAGGFGADGYLHDGFTTSTAHVVVDSLPASSVDVTVQLM